MKYAEAKMRCAVAEQKYLEAQQRTEKASIEAAFAEKDVENHRADVESLEEELKNRLQMRQDMVDRGEKTSPEMQAVLKELDT